MNNILALLLCSLFIVSCKSDENDLSICETTCDDETVTDRLDNVRAKVIVNNTYTNDAGEIFTVYAITINPDDLNSDTWTIDADFILAPCNLPDRFKKENSTIIISGNRKSCCSQLTQPDFRTSYGCKFEITKIEHE